MYYSFCWCWQNLITWPSTDSILWNCNQYSITGSPFRVTVNADFTFVLEKTCFHICIIFTNYMTFARLLFRKQWHLDVKKYVYTYYNLYLSSFVRRSQQCKSIICDRALNYCHLLVWLPIYLFQNCINNYLPNDIKILDRTMCDKVFKK